MKSILQLLFTILFVAVFAQDKNYVEGEIIIKIKNQYISSVGNDFQNGNFRISSLDQVSQKWGIQKASQIGNYKKTGTFLLKFPENINIETAVEEYTQNSIIEFAEPNYIAEGGGKKNEESAAFSNIPNDTYFSTRQWGMLNNGTFSVSGMNMSVTADADVDMELAWDIQTGDPNMIIAVSDSGLRMTHQDINSRIWVNTNEIAGDGIDNDANGLIDDVNGWDWVNDDNNPADDHGHGTNCTGILGTTANNSMGYAGANWNSKIMPLKVLNSSNSGSYADMASSIYYAVDEGAKVISMSIGGSSLSTALTNAINYTNTNNVIFVACMMNFNNNTTYYPAGYSSTHNNVIAVGSTDANDERTAPFFWSPTSGSNYGNHIDVVAPGNYIYSIGSSSNTSYNSYWGGTSQATPLVAGIASLIWAETPSLTPSEVRNVIRQTAEDQVGLAAEDVAGFDQYYGHGRVNAFAALQMAQTLATKDVESKNEGIIVENPVKNGILNYISNENFKEKLNFTIYSFDGKMIFNEDVKVSKGKAQINLQGAPTGGYILNIEGNEYRKAFKLTVK